MKRLWLGIGILLALVGIGFWVMDFAAAHQTAVCSKLESAALRALQEDWAGATAQGAEAIAQWERSREIWAALSDHTELDEIEASFARLEIFSRHGHVTDFAAEAAALSQQIRALSEGHRLSLQNLL